jgi:hypothetical protein
VGTSACRPERLVRFDGTLDAVADGLARRRNTLDDALAAYRATCDVDFRPDRRHRRVAEVLVGSAGIVVLPGGPDPGAVQEVRWHPRPYGVARLVAELVGVTAEDGPPVAGAAPRPWSELVALASRPDGGIGLADVRWADDRRRPLATVLVVAWHRTGGVAEVVPADPAGSAAGGLVRCVPRHPLEVWTGLTALAVRAARAAASRPGRG